MAKTKRPTVKQLADAAIAALPKQVELRYVNYGDSLTPKQVQQVLEGKKDAVDDELFDVYGESEDDSIKIYLENAIDDEKDRERLTDSEKQYERFIQACYERDESNVYGELLKQSGRMMIRVNIFNEKAEHVELDPDSWAWDKAKVLEAAQRLAKALRIDFPSNEGSMVELVQNASGGGNLCVLLYGEVRDFEKAVEHVLRDPEKHRARLTFTNPEMLIHDGWNGSGHEVSVKGDIVVEVGKAEIENRVFAVDDREADTGYSWSDDIAGVVKSHPSYKIDPKIELLGKE